MKLLKEEYLLSKDIANVWSKFSIDQQYDLINALLDGKGDGKTSLASLGQDYKSLKKLPEGVDGGTILSDNNKLSGKPFKGIVNDIVSSINENGWNTDNNKYLDFLTQTNQTLNGEQSAIIKAEAENMIPNKYKLWADSANAYNGEDDYKIKALVFLSTEEADNYISNINKQNQKLNNLIDNILATTNSDEIKNLLRDNQDKTPVGRVYELILDTYKKDGKKHSHSVKSTENGLLFDFINDYILGNTYSDTTKKEFTTNMLKSTPYDSYLKDELDKIRNSRTIRDIETLKDKLTDVLSFATISKDGKSGKGMVGYYKGKLVKRNIQSLDTAADEDRTTAE